MLRALRSPLCYRVLRVVTGAGERESPGIYGIGGATGITFEIGADAS